jgi:transcriptional regulator with XRE-family HTH domain
MKLHEKIQKLRQQQGMSRSQLHEFLITIFGEKTISLRTLSRIESGENDGKSSSLHQIAIGLGLSLQELKRDTEELLPPLECTRKYNRQHGKFTYNPQAWMDFLFGPQARFMMAEMILEPGAQTPVEQDPESDSSYQKGLFVAKGELICTIEKRNFVLRKGDSLLFESRLPHSFANKAPRRAHCVVVQYPPHI